MGVVELLSTSPLPLPLSHPSGWIAALMTRTGFSGQKLGQLEIAQRHAFRDQFRSMRRLLVLACLVVVAAARPTDQAKAKLQKFDAFAAPRQRGPGRRKRKGAPQATALPTNGAWNASTLAEPWREPWYEHWRRGRDDGRAAWARLDA